MRTVLREALIQEAMVMVRPHSWRSLYPKLDILIR